MRPWRIVTVILVALKLIGCNMKVMHAKSNIDDFGKPHKKQQCFKI